MRRRNIERESVLQYIRKLLRERIATSEDIAGSFDVLDTGTSLYQKMCVTVVLLVSGNTMAAVIREYYLETKTNLTLSYTIWCMWLFQHQ